MHCKNTLARTFRSCRRESIPEGLKAISRWFERSEHHRITSNLQSDPERIAARTAVIHTGISMASDTSGERPALIDELARLSGSGRGYEGYES